MSTSRFWTPKDYQEKAIKLAISQASLGLFLDPGLGKTSICLAAFKILKKAGYASKMLVIAPKRAMYATWPNEIAKWSNFEDLTYAVLHGDVRDHNIDCDVDVYLINPDGLEWFYEKSIALKRHKIDVLCVDESTNFKATNTQRFKLFKKHIERYPRRWILTGTPHPNSFTDLYGQTYILDMGKALGKNITAFRKQFLYTDPYKPFQWFVRPGMFDVAMARIAPMVYQLNAEDHIKMPELVPLVIDVILPPEARKIYDEVEDDFITQLEGGTLVANNAAAAGVKCRQIANGAVYLDDGSVQFVHDAKMDAMKSLVEELSGHPLLVLYEFNHDLERLKQAFPQATVLSNDLEGERLRKVMADFNSGQIPMLLGHPQTTGISLNLQDACHHVVWFGLTWNLLYYDQSIRRVARQGQKSDSVFVYHLVAKDTRDERVMEVLTQKDRDQQTVLDALASYRRGIL